MATASVGYNFVNSHLLFSSFSHCPLYFSLEKPPILSDLILHTVL